MFSYSLALVLSGTVTGCYFLNRKKKLSGVSSVDVSGRPNHLSGAESEKAFKERISTLEKELGALIWKHQVQKDASDKHHNQSARISREKDQQLAIMKMTEQSLCAENMELKHKVNEMAQMLPQIATAKKAADAQMVKMQDDHFTELRIKDMRIKDLLTKNDELDNKLKRIGSTARELSELQTTYAALEKSTNQQISQLQLDLKNAASHHRKATADLATLGKRISNLGAQTSESEIRSEKQKALLKRLNVANVAEADALLAKMDELKSKQQQAENNEKRTAQEKALLSQRNIMAAAELSKAEATNEQLLQDKTDLESKCVALEKQTSTANSTQELETWLLEEQRKAKKFEAENIRLTHQLTTEKAGFEAERKSMRRQINDGKAEIARLEQDVARLANKLMLTECKVNDINRIHGKLKENAYQKHNLFLVPENLYRSTELGVIADGQAIFDNAIITLTSGTLDKKDDDALARQVKIYEALVELENQAQDPIEMQQIQARLMQSGLHKDCPRKGYVDSAYYNRSAVSRGLNPLAASFDLAASVPESLAEVFELDYLEMTDSEDVYY